MKNSNITLVKTFQIFSRIILLQVLISLAIVCSYSNFVHASIESEFNLKWQTDSNKGFMISWMNLIGAENWEEGADLLWVEEKIYVVGTIYGQTTQIGLFEVNASSGGLIAGNTFETMNGEEYTWVNSIQKDEKDILYLGGTIQISGKTSSDYNLLLVTYDIQNRKWIDFWNWGTKEPEYGSEMILGNDRMIYFLGTQQNYTDTSDIVIIKLDPQKLESKNETIWVNFYGGVGNQEGNSLLYGTDGYLYVLGTQFADNNDNYWILYKIDPYTGQIVWNISGGTYTSTKGVKIIQDSADAIFLVGSIQSKILEDEDTFVLKINKITKKVEWFTTWGTDKLDIGNDILIFDENSLVVLANINITSINGGEIALIMLDIITGEIESNFIYGGSQDELGNRILINSNKKDELVLLGTIDTSSKTKYDLDIFIVKMIYSNNITHYFDSNSGTFFGLTLLIIICGLLIITHKRIS
ncbi:hypothetical protein [Candidatus Hodarchaeum mangrovi]